VPDPGNAKLRMKSLEVMGEGVRLRTEVGRKGAARLSVRFQGVLERRRKKEAKGSKKGRTGPESSDLIREGE
jgi:hypothetical protein